MKTGAARRHEDARLLALRMEEGALSQRMQVASGSLKSQGNGPLAHPDKNTVLLTPLGEETCTGLLNYRTLR